MAKLATTEREAVRSLVAQAISREQVSIPITKAQLQALVDLIDDELEAAELSILALIPAGPGKTWLVNNASEARRILIAVARRRQETL